MQGLSVSNPNIAGMDVQSFWGPKGYKTISRRTSTGYTLCDQFHLMTEELASIVGAFTKSLGAWSKSWRAKIAKNEECGESVTAALLRLIDAADAVRTSQSTFAADLWDNVIEEMKKYQNANYRRNLVGKVKEAVDLEAGFAASEAPWSKLLKKMNKAKRRYYDLSEKIINVKHQESVARHDTSKAPDYLEEMRTKIDKLELEEAEAKIVYRDSLDKLESYQQKYRENMVFQYDKADVIEIRRLSFFKGLAEKSREAFTQLVLGPRYEDITKSVFALKNSISSICVEDDVREYRRKFGADMTFQNPPYEEYTETVHQVLRGQKLSKKLGSNYGGIRSLSSLNPFKSVSTSMVPTSVQDDAEGPSDGVTVLRIIPKEIPFEEVATPVIDANNNTNINTNNDLNNDENEEEGLPSHAQADPKRSVGFGAVLDELTGRRQLDKGLEPGKQVQVVSVSPTRRRRSKDDISDHTDGEVGRRVQARDTEAAHCVTATAQVVAAIEPLSHPTSNARPAVEPRPANLKIRGTPKRHATASGAPVVMLTQPTPEKGDEDASVFAESANLFPRPKPLEISSTSATNPRLLSSGAGDGGDDGDSHDLGDDGGNVIREEEEEEEPEMTLARGGSALAGYLSSFDEDLTLPDNDDGHHTPIRVSTGVKADRPFAFPDGVSSSSTAIKAPSFDGDLGASVSGRASPAVAETMA